MEEAENKPKEKITKVKKINLYPDKELRDMILREAKDYDRSVNKICLLILTKYFKKDGNNKESQ